MSMGTAGRKRWGNGTYEAAVRYYLFSWGGIILCAFFCCAGIQMIGKDAGVVQMEAFRPDNRSFLEVQVNNQVDEQLEKISGTSGISYEKLLAAVMLKNHFNPEKRIQEAEVISDVLGYERLDENVFLKIASYYKMISESVEFVPVANVYSADVLQYDAGGHVKQMELQSTAGEEAGEFGIRIPVEEKWQEIVPVICMKTGNIVRSDESELTLCLEQEEGIRVIYGNLKQDSKKWHEGEKVQSGEILGSVSGAGLLLQFLLRAEDGSWFDFNGRFCLLHGEKMVRSVTQMLQ